MIFNDRRDAGMRLAKELGAYKGQDVVIFALPRGGVVLGAEIAKDLGAPLDLVITKKVGHPNNPEYAICAVAEQGEPLCNPYELAKVDKTWFQEELKRIRQEIARRRVEYLGEPTLGGTEGGQQPMDIEGKTAIIVDDGIATGFTMMAAIQELKKRNPKKVVVAIPVTPYETAQTLLTMADDLVSLDIDRNYMGAVGAYYRDFRQVSDEEVIALLKSV
jgi:predicted phosphoribosyltransferase